MIVVQLRYFPPTSHLQAMTLLTHADESHVLCLDLESVLTNRTYREEDIWEAPLC